MIGLIGNTGFVGSHLVKQIKIDKSFNSKNIENLQHYDFDILICAGMKGVKWLANKFPAEDNKNLQVIQNALKKINAKQVILISTVDVFSKPQNVTESSPVVITKNNHYGKNRYILEQFVTSNFNNYLICRLSGLVGDNLKKNFLYDLKNNNNIENFNPESSFQYYPIDNLWNDISVALSHGLNLVHFGSEPISVFEISKKFNYDISQFSKKSIKVDYDMKTDHSKIYDQNIDYLYSKEKIFNHIKKYLKK